MSDVLTPEPWNAPLPAGFFTDEMRLTPDHKEYIERDAGRYGYIEEVGNTHRRAKIILALDNRIGELTARLRAAEERERILTDALDRAGVDLMHEATDFTLIGDKAQATWHRERGERLCKLAASSQRAGEGE